MAIKQVELFRRLRDLLGLSQRALAKGLHDPDEERSVVSLQKKISDWERGKGEIPTSKLDRLKQLAREHDAKQAEDVERYIAGLCDYQPDDLYWGVDGFLEQKEKWPYAREVEQHFVLERSHYAKEFESDFASADVKIELKELRTSPDCLVLEHKGNVSGPEGRKSPLYVTWRPSPKDDELRRLLKEMRHPASKQPATTSDTVVDDAWKRLREISRDSPWEWKVQSDEDMSMRNKFRSILEDPDISRQWQDLQSLLKGGDAPKIISRGTMLEEQQSQEGPHAVSYRLQNTGSDDVTVFLRTEWASPMCIPDTMAFPLYTPFVPERLTVRVDFIGLKPVNPKAVAVLCSRVAKRAVSSERDRVLGEVSPESKGPGVLSCTVGPLLRPMTHYAFGLCWDALEELK